MFNGNNGGGQQPPGMNYLNQVPGIFNPYYQNGLNAGNVLSGQYNQMATNPNAYVGNLMGGYQPSQEYQLTQKFLGQNAANTAAAGGERGSQYDVSQQSDLTNRLLQGDMQQFLQNRLGVAGMGLQGEQGMYNTGLQAGTDMGNAYNNMSQLAFEQWRQKMSDQAQRSSSMWGGLGAIGGGILGGPMGSWIGSQIGGGGGGFGYGGSSGLPQPFQA